MSGWNDRNPDHCPERSSALEYLRGELGPGEKAAYEHHLECCWECRSEVEDLRAFLRDLELAGDRLAPPPSFAELPARVLARTCGRSARRRPRTRRTVAFAAPVGAALCAVGIAALVSGIIPGGREGDRGRKAGPPAGLVSQAEGGVLESARRWLVSVQAPDGSWDAAAWGGDRDCTIGLTALAVRALLDAAGSAERRAAERGLRYLAREARADGSLGPPSSALAFNQALGAGALLEAWARGFGGPFKEAAARAAANLASLQRADGSWDGNRIVTAWALEALRRAEALGLGGGGPALVRARTWLEGRARGPETVVWSVPRPAVLAAALGLALAGETGGRPDAARRAAEAAVRETLLSGKVERLTPGAAYFAVQLARAADARGLLPWAERIRAALSELQVRQGPERGSWERAAGLEPAGGRACATALAVLALQAAGA